MRDCSKMCSKFSLFKCESPIYFEFLAHSIVFKVPCMVNAWPQFSEQVHNGIQLSLPILKFLFIAQHISRAMLRTHFPHNTLLVLSLLLNPLLHKCDFIMFYSIRFPWVLYLALLLVWMDWVFLRNCWENHCNPNWEIISIVLIKLLALIFFVPSDLGSTVNSREKSFKWSKKVYNAMEIEHIQIQLQRSQWPYANELTNTTP